MKAYAVLFVCMGNICRSPTAHGVFRHRLVEGGLADRVRVDSAGTHGYHAGRPPDERSQEHAAQRGYDLSDLRARQLLPRDFEQHDLVLVMDHENFRHARELCLPGQLHKLRRFTEFCQQHKAQVVPDPYYEGAQGFEEVLDLVEDACTGLLQHVQTQLRQG
ncbi:MAG: low molecular weight phosphotyrosine protein phosphatase [Burkholderiales bacterium]|nr:low molecular weight phosphotyrosine protein phosphatase [Burkholderiales bacterium]